MTYVWEPLISSLAHDVLFHQKYLLKFFKWCVAVQETKIIFETLEFVFQFIFLIFII